jgi:nucleoside-diphosphate-sugar epimerase
MSKFLVTGGAGFIGSNLVDALLESGDSVRVLDNLSTGCKENLRDVWSEIEFLRGDIRDVHVLSEAVRDVDYILHTAALRAVLQSVDDPIATNEINVTGTLQLLLHARKAGVKRVVLSSSSSVYGDTARYPVSEEETPCPLSPYAASKIMGEYYARIFSDLYGLETVCLRYFNVFGPRQNPQSKYSAVIPIFIDCLVNGRGPEVHGDGTQSRDFSYIDNVVDGNLKAVGAGSKGVAGQVFNIACRDECSVLDLLNYLKVVLKAEGVKPVFKPKREGDIRRSFADISKAEKILGYQVRTRWQDGLEKTVKWFLDSGALKP